VPASKPRFFVRGVNSSREINAALRFRRQMHESLPGEQKMFFLFIVDLQAEEGPMAISSDDGHGMLFYGITEKETTFNMSQGKTGFALCSETYTRAVAFAIKHFSGEPVQQDIRVFANLRQLSASCVQFDGGDTGRELFTPRKFYGQHMDSLAEAPFQNLFSKTQVQMFLLPKDIDVTAVFPVEVFGRSLKVQLPVGAKVGDVLQLLLNDSVLSATVSTLKDGQWIPVGPASVSSA